MFVVEPDQLGVVDQVLAIGVQLTVALGRELFEHVAVGVDP